MARVAYVTVTLDRIADDGRKFESFIHIGPDGFIQQGEELGETVDVAEAIFAAVADALNEDDDDN